MPDSDAIMLGEDWISEYYFTTDAKKQSFQARVLERRKSWDDERSTRTARTRFTAPRPELLDNLVLLDSGEADPAVVHKKLIDVLGFDGVGLSLAVTGPATFVTAPGLASASSLVILEARPL